MGYFKDGTSYYDDMRMESKKMSKMMALGLIKMEMRWGVWADYEFQEPRPLSITEQIEMASGYL